MTAAFLGFVLFLDAASQPGIQMIFVIGVGGREPLCQLHVLIQQEHLFNRGEVLAQDSDSIIIHIFQRYILENQERRLDGISQYRFCLTGQQGQGLLLIGFEGLDEQDALAAQRVEGETQYAQNGKHQYQQQQ